MMRGEAALRAPGESFSQRVATQHVGPPLAGGQLADGQPRAIHYHVPSSFVKLLAGGRGTGGHPRTPAHLSRAPPGGQPRAIHHHVPSSSVKLHRASGSQPPDCPTHPYSTT
ncbi:MAG: hypothetical protein J2P37_08280 [Ktedonobacteraceae bacterium]|nr:hypothetical protein [Ktedonobacteraceae bacterium]MBO0790406.1 hypothetical protein [Ktedonobacteraceae bacterium]